MVQSRHACRSMTATASLRELTLTLPRKTTSTRMTVSNVLKTRQHSPLMALLAMESCSRTYPCLPRARSTDEVLDHLHYAHFTHLHQHEMEHPILTV